MNNTEQIYRMEGVGEKIEWAAMYTVVCRPGYLPVKSAANQSDLWVRLVYTIGERSSEGGTARGNDQGTC